MADTYYSTPTKRFRENKPILDSSEINELEKTIATYSKKAAFTMDVEEYDSNRYSSDDSRVARKSLFASDSTFNLKENIDSLAYSFLDSLESYNSLEQIFDLINGFVENCNEVLEYVGSNIRQSDLTWLENEKNTWRLIFALYHNRLEYVKEDLTLHPMNELDIMKNLFQNDNAIRECQLVIDWLEECAATRVDHEERPKLSHFMDKTVAWENTLHQLQIKNAAYTSQRPLVTALDPDAPHRQNKQIHDLDMEDEARLLEQIFLEIRCGRLRKAIDICNLSGHKWRAAILQGWMLFNDPNYGKSSEIVTSSFGNPHRTTWKVCAWQLTEKSNTAVMWKAILGVFCGNLSVVTPVCKEWEDLLWAYLKVYIDVKVETEISALSLNNSVNLPDQYWDFKYTMHEIFEELAGATDAMVRIEASRPERIIQRLIITDNLPELFAIMSDWCESETVSIHLVRMCAHIVLCVRMVGFANNKPMADRILRSYAKRLMKFADPKLVAYYTATLSEEDQITYYSAFIEGIENESQREKCLEYAELCRLPIEAITQRVVQIARAKTEERKNTLDLATGITKEDDKIISSLDWIMHYPLQRAEAMWETNALIRYFLTQRNLQAAQFAFCKIPEDSIAIIMSKLGLDRNQLWKEPASIPAKIHATVREYLCYKVYLDAEVKFADWFNTYHKTEPTKPQKPSEEAPFSDKVAYEHLIAKYNADYNKWKAVIAEQTQVVKSHLYNVLVFPDGGWLVETRFFEDNQRLNELVTLRKLCIPKIVILLHTILHSMEMYEECLKLAETITSETHHIYKAYSKQDLGELLKKLCDTSVCFLNLGKDPWGMPASF